jgi:hypothetical protein
MARQITIVIMGGATDSLMECVNIRMGVDNDEYIRKFGISNVGSKVTPYIFVRVLASATHGILKPWQFTLYLTLSTRNYYAEFNYIYTIVVRDNNDNFMDEFCGHLVTSNKSRTDMLFRATTPDEAYYFET